MISYLGMLSNFPLLNIEYSITLKDWEVERARLADGGGKRITNILFQTFNHILNIFFEVLMLILNKS